MAPSDIERLAREAGMVVVGDQFSLLPFLVRFAALVRAQALEDAARTIERTYGINAAAIRALAADPA